MVPIHAAQDCAGAYGLVRRRQLCFGLRTQLCWLWVDKHQPVLLLAGVKICIRTSQV